MYVMLLIWKIRLAVFMLALLKYTCLLSDNIYFIFISMWLRGTVNMHFVRMASKGLIKFSCLCSSYTEAAGSNAAFNVSANVGCTFNKVGEYGGGGGGGACCYLGRTTSTGPGACTRPLLHVCGAETQRESAHTAATTWTAAHFLQYIMVRFHLVCST